ncbi:MAG TPA: winged helix-turn-helix domain-containing protein [Acidobacteriaceae bacterium]|nr:winged helix-turn-helix domain-containing protein [Acidobacteriaceae bacterium]
MPTSTRFRFDAFELDPASGELRKAGRLLKLQPQPFRVLALLIEHADQLVSREEIQRCLWQDSTFVDFEHGINFSINQIRAALGDSAAKPRYVETLPRRGYRFVGKLEQEPVPKPPEPPALEQTVPPALVPPAPVSPGKSHSRRALILSFALLLGLLVLASLQYWRGRRTPATNVRKALAVIEIENHSQDPALNWLGDGVVDLLTTDLAQANNLDTISSERVRDLIGRQVKPGQALAPSQAQAVAQKAGADLFISGGILKMGNGLRLDLRVQDTASGKVLLAEKVEGESPQAVFSMVDETTDRIVSRLSAGEPRPSGGKLTSSFGALHAYEESVTDYNRSMDEEATASLQRAVELDPQFAMAYFELAKLLPDYRARHEAITRAALLAERQGLPEQQRLLIHARQFVIEDRLEEAIQTFQTIIRRFPKEIQPRYFLSGQLLGRGELKEGTAVLEEAAKLDDSKETLIWNDLAYDYALQGDWSRALDAVDRYAALLPPNDPNPIDTRADVYAMAGNPGRALAEYKRNLEAHPDFSYTREKIALVYLLAGRNREAEEAAQSAYQKTKGARRALAIEVQGDVALVNGNLDLAEKHYEQAAGISGQDPLRARTQTWKAGEVYFEQQKPQAALTMAKRLPGFGAAEVRGVAYLLLGNGAEAENEFTSARSSMVPFFSDRRADALITLDRLRAAKYSSQWRQVIDGWPALADYLKPLNGFLAGRAYAELALFPQAEAQLHRNLRFVCAGALISDEINFLQVELADFYLGKVQEAEGKKADAMKSYRAFLSHFDHSKAALPQINEARSGVQRLQ